MSRLQQQSVQEKPHRTTKYRKHPVVHIRIIFELVTKSFSFRAASSQDSPKECDLLGPSGVLRSL